MKRKRVIVLVIIIVLVAAGFIAAALFAKAINQPASGAITVTAKPDSNTYTINLTPKKITGKYVSFDYPSGLTPRQPQAVAAPNVETLDFAAQDITSWLLAVDVSVLKGDSLSGDSGFAYRQANPAIYQESHLSVNGQAVDVMTDKTADFSKVAYIIHGGFLVTVSLYGDDSRGTQPLQTSFMMVLNSLRWL